MSHARSIVTGLVLALAAPGARAEEAGPYRAAVEVLVDLSQGMGAREGEATLLAAALEGVDRALARKEFQGAEIAVRTMGGVAAGRQRCEATRQVVPGGVTAGPVLEPLRKRQVAMGPRPITAALEGAVADLPQSPGLMRALVILTAGGDGCGRDVCEAAAELRHTLGLGRVRVVALAPGAETLGCLGEVVSARTAADVEARIVDVLDAMFSPAELTVTALDKGKPGSAEVELFPHGDETPVLRMRSGETVKIAGGHWDVRVARAEPGGEREGWRRDVELSSDSKIAIRVPLGGESATLVVRVRLNGADAPEGTHLYVHRPGTDEDPVADGWPDEELRVPPGTWDVRAQLPATGIGSIDVWKPDVKVLPGDTTRVTLDARQKLGALRVQVMSGEEELEGADVLVLPDKSRSLDGSVIPPGDLVPVPSGTYTVGVHFETPGGPLAAFKDGVKVGTDTTEVTLDVGPSSLLVVQVEGADESTGITVGLVRRKGEDPLGYIEAFTEHRVPPGTYDLRLEEPMPIASRVYWARGITVPPGERKVVTTKKPKPRDQK